MIPLRVRLHREYNRWYKWLLRWCWSIQGKDAPRVYMFHSVVDTREQVYSQFAITKESFERFIEQLVAQGQKALDTEMLLRAIDAPCNYANHYCITFDDIYDSVYTNAYPVLKKYNIPFVVFVTDGLVLEHSVKHLVHLLPKGKANSSTSRPYFSANMRFDSTNTFTASA